jgi:hypothetical protein
MSTVLAGGDGVEVVGLGVELPPSLALDHRRVEQFAHQRNVEGEVGRRLDPGSRSRLVDAGGGAHRLEDAIALLVRKDGIGVVDAFERQFDGGDTDPVRDGHPGRVMGDVPPDPWIFIARPLPAG